MMAEWGLSSNRRLILPIEKFRLLSRARAKRSKERVYFLSCQVDLEALRHSFGTREMDVRELFRIDK